MSYKIANAPCSWGVDDPKNPYLPPWKRVLKEAQLAGYKSIELGPYSYLPTDPVLLSDALNEHGLSIVAGTIFDDLVTESYFPNILELTKNICSLISKIPTAEKVAGMEYQPPYLVVIDFGNPERAKMAGQVKESPRLSKEDWARMIKNIKYVSKLAWEEYGVRPVIHPHAGGCIEFSDEIKMIANDISYDIAGFCLDTGHLYYSGMDPILSLNEYQDRLDYLHFKDVNKEVFDRVIPKKIDFFKACAEGVMCPIGTGAIDYPKVKQFLDNIKYQGWITIEQERDPRNVEGSLTDVTNSLKFLHSVGF
ncbi:TIM barrel protein [Gilliamella sp. wkB112]|uniref:TIM barrel protein n=1 Tax=Gilliamella sp. wkB112 TaxID=3120257 RepID=UPI00080E3E3C|nr:TIM barrel protein [Gilliamella apicola]OCG02086.1 AP endonuclease [Gilliamella apicola]